MILSSNILEDAVEAIASLPGIGKKTALRIVLHIINGNMDTGKNLSEKLGNLDEINFCKKCHNVCDAEYCSICTAGTRQQNTICVVENIRDLIAIENTQQFNGVYHVLGGLISPLDGISPEDLNIDTLIARVSDSDIPTELIMAISPTLEGETTIFYISGLIPQHVKVSLISRGVSFGGELEYTDELTLGRSIITRIPYNNVNTN